MELQDATLWQSSTFILSRRSHFPPYQNANLIQSLLYTCFYRNPPHCRPPGAYSSNAGRHRRHFEGLPIRIFSSRESSQQRHSILRSQNEKYYLQEPATLLSLSVQRLPHRSQGFELTDSNAELLTKLTADEQAVY